VLLHEVHHVVLGHLTYPAFRRVDQPRLMELAMEISANEFIREVLPGDPPRWQLYQRFGIGTGQSTMERYSLLREAMARGEMIVIPDFVDAHIVGGIGGVPEVGAGDRLADLIRSAIDEAGPGGGKLAGREPGHFVEALADPDADPRTFMDWRTALEMFIASQRVARTTYQRPNRRFPGRVGEIPGRVRHPGRTRPKKMLVAIDTSGSMSGPELAEVARQLRRLRDLVDFVVAECDTTIQRVYPFDGVIRDVAGRGGTDLRPVFDDAFLREHRPDGVIYFTDGQGPYPSIDPGVKTLWVMTKPWDFPCTWGQRAWMRGEERQPRSI